MSNESNNRIYQIRSTTLNAITKRIDVLAKENEELKATLLKLENYTKDRKEYFHKIIENQLEENKELKDNINLKKLEKELCEFHYESITTCDSSSCNISPDYCKHHNDLNYDKCDDCDYETEQEIIATRKKVDLQYISNTDYLKNRNDFLADYSEKFEASKQKRKLLNLITKQNKRRSA